MKKLFISIGKSVVALVYDNSKIVLPKTKGLVQLIELLANPDKHLHCTLLQADDIRKVWETERNLEPLKELFLHNSPRKSFYRPFTSFSKDPIMDDEYLKSIIKEIERLSIALEKAKADNDIGKSELFESELFVLQDYLLKNTNISGKSRSMPREYDKAKDAVRKSLNKALTDIKDKDCELWEHLTKAVRIGEHNCYHSLPSVEVSIRRDAETDAECSGVTRNSQQKPKITDLTIVCETKGNVSGKHEPGL